MASIKQTDILKTEAPDALKGQGVTTGLADSKMEPCNKINNGGGNVMSDENDRNSVVSSIKSADPARKKMFKITSVKKGGNGDIGVDNDADSIDGLDESQTEDFSSEIYDCSRATDLDMDIQDYINIPLTPDEVISTTTIMVKQKPDHNSQSRFKVVKIETKEPFRRGKWVCYDFYDTAAGTVVTVEKNGSNVAEDSIIHSALLDGHSFPGSVHYVHDVNDSSSNIFIPPVIPLSPARDDGLPVHSDVFVPIQPAPASQVLNQLDGLTSDVMPPFIAQQVLMSVAGVPSSSSSFHNLAQPGHTTIIQSVPHTNVFPYGQNVPSVGMFQNGIPSGQPSEAMNVPPESLLVGTGSPNMLATAAPVAGNNNLLHSQAFPGMSGLAVPRSRSQTQVGGDTVVTQGVPTTAEAGLSPAGVIHHSRTEGALAGPDVDQMGPGMSESSESIKTLQGDVDAHPSESLIDAVDTVGDMCIGLDVNEEDPDERTAELLSMLSNLPIERPSTLPFHLHRSNVDSPFGFCLTPVRSLCASPVQLSFMEHYDPLVSIAGIFPVRVVTPTLPPFVSPSTSSLMEPEYRPPLPEPITFPHSDSFIPPSYYPVQQHLLFSSGSAFVPLGMPSTSIAPMSTQMGTSVSWSPTSMSVSTSQFQQTSPTDRTNEMSSLSPEFPVMSAHKSASLASTPSSQPLNNCDGATADTAWGTDSRGAANTTGYNSNQAEFVTTYTPTSESLPDVINGGSTVAIDNKIEQAMDLVKRHLMYAVREEVEILKQQIGEMMERIGQLEYENTILRSEAKPETLSKLLQPRASQTSQTVLPGQNASIMSGSNLQQSQQTTSMPAAQSQPSQQQAVQPSSQQQVPQTPLFQAGQSPL